MGERVTRISIREQLSRGEGLPETDLKTAIANLETSRQLYLEARLEVLRHRQGRFYGVAGFGGATLNASTPEFRKMSQVARNIVRESEGMIDVVTGGGNGIMLAFNEGADLAREELKETGQRPKSRNHGIGIELPWEQGLNSHINIATMHSDFTPRLQEFFDKTNATILGPGGFGSDAERALVVQLKQVQHLERTYPIIAFSFWQPVIEEILNKTYIERVENGQEPLIDAEDFGLVTFSDDPDEISHLIIKDFLITKEQIWTPVQEAYRQQKLVAKTNGHHSQDGNGLHAPNV